MKLLHYVIHTTDISNKYLLQISRSSTAKQPTQLSREPEGSRVQTTDRAGTAVLVQTHPSLVDGVALTFFRSLKTFRLTFLRMSDKCKIINVHPNDKGFSI